MLENKRRKYVTGLWAAMLCLFIFFVPDVSQSGQWVNPKDIIKDPVLARLQQGKTKLTNQEKKEIKEYGYTGLELITYVDINTRPDGCWDYFERAVIVTADRHIKVHQWLYKEKYYYKNPASFLTLDDIKPGDIMTKNTGIYFSPPERRYRGWLYYIYLTSEEHIKDKEGWQWLHELRRYRRCPTTAKDDHWLGSVLCYEEVFKLRRPWEEDHTIIGEDLYNGNECLVVESRNHNPDYYLSKRVTWIEKENFLDLHEEQFDRKGRRSLIMDKLWVQTRPLNYWVRSQWNCADPRTGRRIVRRSYDWRFEQQCDDGEFLPATMGKEYFWTKARNLPPVRHISDLPPEPQVRWEFWNTFKAEKQQ